jgi:hypothetical protein
MNTMVPSNPDPDCFELSKERRIDDELQDLDRINQERAKQGLALLTYTEYIPEIHRLKLHEK